MKIQHLKKRRSEARKSLKETLKDTPMFHKLKGYIEGLEDAISLAQESTTTQVFTINEFSTEQLDAQSSH